MYNIQHGHISYSQWNMNIYSDFMLILESMNYKRSTDKMSPSRRQLGLLFFLYPKIVWTIALEEF